MTTPTSRRILTISAAAKFVGVHTHAITLAEKEGRIPAALRDELGHRIYDGNDLERLKLLMGRSDRVRRPSP
jgi:DNA-binding transcriptional MerR regulator